MSILFSSFGLLAGRNYLTIQYFDYVIVWRRLIQKLVVRTHLEIYVFIYCVLIHVELHFYQLF